MLIFVKNLNRFVLSGAGGVDHDQLVELANQHFGKMSGPEYSKIPEVDLPCRYTGSEIRVRDDSIPLAHVALAVEGNSMFLLYLKRFLRRLNFFS